jgi:hypothetical protein
MSEEENKGNKGAMSLEFIKVIKDLTKDLYGTFPDKMQGEYDDEKLDENMEQTYIFCKEVYPSKFFDILYQKNELFTKPLELLPGIDFSELWNSDISDATKATLWKYLQLILFSVVSDTKSNETFGDASKLFEAIDEDEFKKKIADTIGEMEHLFQTSDETTEGETSADGSGTTDTSGNKLPGMNNLPNAEEIHDHINKMMEGKLGSLAKEIAEETAQDFNIDVENTNSVNDVFKQLFKNPTKLMDLVKNVGTKLDTKIKSGAIKESELLEEASELVNNMKNMPGMDNLEGMLSKMGLPGMGGGKMDMGALNRQMQQNLQSAKARDRMRTKLEKNTAAKAATAANMAATAEVDGISLTAQGINNAGMEEFTFSTGDDVERSSTSERKKKKKAKGKKR